MHQVVYNIVFLYKKVISNTLLINDLGLRINIQITTYNLEFLIVDYFINSFFDSIEKIDYNAFLIGFSSYSNKIFIRYLVEDWTCLK